ncbi:hypothetical protein [Chryseobacterium vrystaatense]|uniref:Heat shock protein HslJ n=1 Tax=Chryseobacterium vrystaatense TaxID=307480 RepID=A0A1M5JKV8_9FLAO|nr:hypothetical protein [Chryseobacterium vrystaatense]SHG40899.1 hypothetical protein SAMN02787073_4226 [Chryseobacterium vrystaatense]
MKRIICVLTLFLFLSCSISKDEVLGKYEYRGEKMIDSIIIENDLYTHKIFNKQGKLMYQGSSEWKLLNSRITFSNFYINEDAELENFFTEEQAEEFLMLVSCPVYKDNRQIVIETNADENIRYVKK